MHLFTHSASLRASMVSKTDDAAGLTFTSINIFDLAEAKYGCLTWKVMSVKNKKRLLSTYENL